MAGTWQFLGTTIGGYKLLKENKNELFWTNKEKWEIVQHFSKQGVKVTKKGWENDFFRLYSTGVGMEKSLFDKIRPIHE